MPTDRCWIDGHSCPYGVPDGQFLLRPTVDCWEGEGEGTGCDVYRKHIRGREIPQERQDEIVDEYFDAHAMRTSEWLHELAQRFPQESAHRLAFQQLADEIGTSPLKQDQEVLIASATPRERQYRTEKR